MVAHQLAPILITGFNRPKTLASLLVEVEKLPNREVWISIDGPRDDSDKVKVLQVLDVVSSWKENSIHSVRVLAHRENLGLYDHCVRALTDFFQEFEVGIVLEDDMQFSFEFIKFVDDHYSDLNSGKYWSICGHNPVSDLSDISSDFLITFRNSHLHTIWGWATNRSSVGQFLKLANEKSLESINRGIEAGARQISRDPFVEFGIRKVWQFKMQRALISSGGGGWDNFWVIAGWLSGLTSLMPDYSLTRENPNQPEGQSHRHENFGKTWPSSDQELRVQVTKDDYRLGSEVPLLKVWGITRIYCWVFFYRIYKWKPNAHS